jgi:hypothetical protein
MQFHKWQIRGAHQFLTGTVLKRHCRVGTSDNSPAFQRRVRSEQSTNPEGTAEEMANSTVPSGRNLKVERQQELGSRCSVIAERGDQVGRFHHRTAAVSEGPAAATTDAKSRRMIPNRVASPCRCGWCSAHSRTPFPRAFAPDQMHNTNFNFQAPAETLQPLAL